MRTNIVLPDNLHAEFKACCSHAGKSMAEVIREYMEIEIAKRTYTAIEGPKPEPPNTEYADMLAEKAERNAEMLRRVRTGEPMQRIANSYGVSVSRVSRIVAKLKGVG